VVRSTYRPEELGKEVVAPSGYYVPIQEEVVEYDGRSLLVVRGTGCLESSCCGAGTWEYLRVEGYVLEQDYLRHKSEGLDLALETVEDEVEKAEIAALLSSRHPGARIEFR
jgi:hypothetical protein